MVTEQTNVLVAVPGSSVTHCTSYRDGRLWGRPHIPASAVPVAACTVESDRGKHWISMDAAWAHFAFLAAEETALGLRRCTRC